MAAAAEPVGDAAPGGRRELSDRERAILRFEHEWWRHAGAKEEAIRLQFGLSAARYYQLLNALLDTPAAVVHDPMLIRRLQRVRDARTAARGARTTASADRTVKDRAPTDD